MNEEIREKLELIKGKIEEFRDILSIERKKGEVPELQMKMADPGFWKDEKKSAPIIEELKNFKEDIDSFEKLEKRFIDLEELAQLDDESLSGEVLGELEGLKSEVSRFELKVLFCDRFDQENAIVEINAGAGGTEACDWAGMLFRMYFRWAEDKKFGIKVFEEIRGEEAGIKNMSFLVQGRYAYGYLRSEKGVHRLVRVSPFDANKRRHTSFASVGVIPEIKDDRGVEINPEDLKIDTFRASGCGGQHVNRTDSAVRITHVPTGIVVGCQNERSQYQNKQTALRILRAKLYELQEEEKNKELEKLSAGKRKIEWGSQIRSYILHPYLMVKDHRTQLEAAQARDVLDGKIDGFIYQYLLKQRSNA